MSVGDRIRAILSERNLTQGKFAESLDVTPSYINFVANDKKRKISKQLAQIIEQKYGYSAQWLLEGVGEKIVRAATSLCKDEIIDSVQRMTENEAKATLAFIKTLESINVAFTDSGQE